MRIANPGAISLGDMRILKRRRRVFVQEYVPGGWQYTQLHPGQTLTSCVRALKQKGFTYFGREPGDTVYYYHPARPLTTDDLMPGSTRDEQITEALDSITRLYGSGLDGIDELIAGLFRSPREEN